MPKADPQAVGTFLVAFFDGLIECGVRNVVICPGSRSTPLAMTAYEIAKRDPKRLRILVDVDERGAAFAALGMGKSTGVPAVVICTSGSAVANFFPAVVEAEASGVPLLVLTGDRPPQLQGLGAPQTCDQLHLFGSHVRTFRQMPLPTDDPALLSFARQAALEAVIAARPVRGLKASSVPVGAVSTGGPVHVNFPFDEPLKPEFNEELFDTDSENKTAFLRLKKLIAPEIDEPIAATVTAPSSKAIEAIFNTLRKKRIVIVAGEGSVFTEHEAKSVLDFADYASIPVLADPLSGLRGRGYDAVIEGYDALLATDLNREALQPDAVIRFGRYPVSKRLTTWLEALRDQGVLTITVDAYETKDFNATTDLFVPCTAASFTRAVMTDWLNVSKSILGVAPHQRNYYTKWEQANEALNALYNDVEHIPYANEFEGAYVHALLSLLPADSCLFVGNSMSIRAVDTFCRLGSGTIQILGNRGLNGIDGTLSTMFGVAWAQPSRPVTLLLGDLALIHDVNAFALQRELFSLGLPAPSIVVVLLNNNGGAIFDMLPQSSDDPYFERLFMTPQDVDFKSIAEAFSVPYQQVSTVDDFRQAYAAMVGKPGFHLIDVAVPLRGVKQRYGRYWGLQ